MKMMFQYVRAIRLPLHESLDHETRIVVGIPSDDEAPPLISPALVKIVKPDTAPTILTPLMGTVG